MQTIGRCFVDSSGRGHSGFSQGSASAAKRVWPPRRPPPRPEVDSSPVWFVREARTNQVGLWSDSRL
ncbi:MAG: hypothetical protein MZV64_73710 [Ignavibacteriales bacterium]|nr:hypothetical protein [Ignavibacteriales bacterium]